MVTATNLEKRQDYLAANNLDYGIKAFTDLVVKQYGRKYLKSMCPDYTQKNQREIMFKGRLELDHVVQLKSGEFGVVEGINKTKAGISYTISGNQVELKDIESRWVKFPSKTFKKKEGK